MCMLSARDEVDDRVASEVSDGASALAQIAVRPPAVVVLDVVMPRPSGIEARMGR
ncbi:hypothetical protein [Parafrankia sp. Ea1.12]|uniref:hypothetical protein n=1 Tax=Parafrankia sp. Ea1.12 TaxID=573499 RepID=UPI001F388CAB|nr:hypothetical protein [Parafrankia sp. Ea1.12]